jgi:hypothetical protein
MVHPCHHPCQCKLPRSGHSRTLLHPPYHPPSWAQIRGTLEPPLCVCFLPTLPACHLLGMDARLPQSPSPPLPSQAPLTEMVSSMRNLLPASPVMSTGRKNSMKCQAEWGRK